MNAKLRHIDRVLLALARRRRIVVCAKQHPAETILDQLTRFAREAYAKEPYDENDLDRR